MGFLDSAGLARFTDWVRGRLADKLDKTGTAVAAAKLATARTIRTNLASTSAVNFDGTANVTPGVIGTLPISNGGTGAATAAAALTALGAMPASGGTMTGNLTLRNNTTYGMKINFGDGDYVHLYEISDDTLEIKATSINFVTGNATNAITWNGTNMGLVPAGCIVMWSGAASAIPTGWRLCNGANGTPDLRDKFVVGAGSTYSVGATGGEASHKLTTAEMPSHTHVVPTSDSGNYTVGYYVNAQASRAQAGTKNNAVLTMSVGSNGAHNNLPPYYALCYIMKL